MTQPGRDVDVVVLGSGCAGLTAALAAAAEGATVRVYERATTIGGMSAISAGIVWIPAHDRLPEADLSVEAALEYLRAQSMGFMDDAMIETFVRTAPEMIEFVEAHSPLRFTVVPGVTDHKPELPGGRSNGRSLIPGSLDASGLGEWLDKITVFDQPHSGAGFDVQTGSRHGGYGGATLIQGLLAALLALDVDVCTNARARELVVEDGVVVGVRFDDAGGRSVVRARRGVILATGGFEWSKELTTAFLRAPMYSAAWPPNTEGDGLRMAMSVGAELGNMAEAWWLPVVDIEQFTIAGRPRGWGFLFERTRPRSMLVNRAGRRFVNEAADSTSAAGAFQYQHPRDGYVNHPAWLIFDSGHLDRYGAFGVPPGGGPTPDWFNESPSLDALAARTGIDATGLARTIEEWNRNMVELKDPEFGRGVSAHDGWSGDREAGPLAARTLGPIDTSPFFAVPASIGVLGTKGGPRTDRDGRVRHVLGGMIPGLFAAGNAMAGVTVKAYGGLGGTMGPAMVFGYRAGCAAGRGDTEP